MHFHAAFALRAPRDHASPLAPPRQVVEPDLHPRDDHAQLCALIPRRVYIDRACIHSYLWLTLLTVVVNGRIAPAIVQADPLTRRCQAR